ncbi:hypothetical protein PF005_g30588 [Phytophthora fragariae]|nr:hypothetical protein PF003_g21864 [Phytophthora fragariae]KAE8961995.1 hypothetical protein PF011_g29548 [Phytophthora fragariae]KAE9060342.1 hypothetical protein PF010_g30259 [Phytophthora fragariae]KAE9066096.1 hypothetical protein PF006_g30315 [Phytophthora fragariae]KAE9163090.1 hypothetical protein PF005_g30588 [Phytophthora fragariae]
MNDTDGDGQTNGQELGDPCCQWNRTSNPVVLWTIGHANQRTERDCGAEHLESLCHYESSYSDEPAGYDEPTYDNQSVHYDESSSDNQSSDNEPSHCNHEPSEYDELAGYD